MKVRAIIVGSNELVVKKGDMKPGSQVLTVKDKKYMVTKIWNKKVGILGRKYVPYAIAMDGEPRTLHYMDNFDSEAFEAFLKETVVDVKSNGVEVDEALKRIYAWKGADSQIADIDARPYLDRKFRASPVTDEHLHRAITDPQRAMLMRGKGLDPLILIIILAIVVSIVAGMAIYALAFGTTTTGSPADDFEVIEEVVLRLRMWWYG